MAPTFSNPSKIVTVTGTVDVSGADGAFDVTDADVRRVTEDTLRQAARANRVAITSLEVTVANGPRTVTMTEDEFNALLQQGGTTDA
jgi:hypothetical protein